MHGDLARRLHPYQATGVLIPPQAFHFCFSVLPHMQIPNNIHFGDIPLNRSGWATCASWHGDTQRRHQVNTDCLDSLTITCELRAVPTSCLHSVRNLCWCAYDVISTGLFPREAAVKHLRLPLALHELVTLYSGKQP